VDEDITFPCSQVAAIDRAGWDRPDVKRRTVSACNAFRLEAIGQRDYIWEGLRGRGGNCHKAESQHQNDDQALP
jgi:hypothetical protein